MNLEIKKNMENNKDKKIILEGIFVEFDKCNRNGSRIYCHTEFLKEINKIKGNEMYHNVS